MPHAAITYDIKGGFEEEVAAVFADYKRPEAAVAPDAGGGTRIVATSVFIRDSLLVRFIEYDGDLEAMARFMAVQPGVQELERKLAPYLSKPRDTATVEGFVETFKSNLLRSVLQLSGPRRPA